MSELKSYENQIALQKNELGNGKEAMAILNSMIKAGQAKQNKDGTWVTFASTLPEKK